MLQKTALHRLPRACALALATVALLVSGAGCGNACRDLVSQVCGCLPDDGTRAACTQRGSQTADVFPLRQQDQNYCQHQLDTHACDCKQLDTPDGKRSCGLAYSYATGAPTDAGSTAP